MSRLALPHKARFPLQPSPYWYGAQPWWRIWVEASARREFGQHLQSTTGLDRIAYRIRVEVRGRLEAVGLTIAFYERPTYHCYGLPAEEYPRVVPEDAGAMSPHRMPGDQALCLYYPLSPPHQRWRPENGLLSLIDLARRHLFLEDHWRATGGKYGGVWLGAEQPHGLPSSLAA